MCGPALIVGAAIVAAYSQYQQSQSAAKASNYSAEVAKQNQGIQEKAAIDAENRGADTASQQRQNYIRANATVRANAAGSGLLADTGTFGQIQDQNTQMGEMNVLTARNNAEREAYGYRLNATSYANQAQADQFSASSSRFNGLLSAGSTLVSGASKAYGGGFGGFSGSGFNYGNLGANINAPTSQIRWN